MLPTKELFRFRFCPWCRGSGCNQCEIEANKAYKREFPNGPQPIATFAIPDEMDAARNLIGREAIEKAFRQGGGGVREIIDNCEQYQAQKESK